MWLYFKFLVKMYRLFFFLALLAIPTIAICFAGTSLSSGVEQTKTVASSTVGNVGNSLNTTLVTVPLFDRAYTKKDIGAYMAGMDFACCVLILVFIWAHSLEEKADAQDADDRALTAGDYSLRVLNLPPNMPVEQLRLRLRDWFEDNGFEVYDIAVCGNDSDLLELYGKLGRVYTDVQSILKCYPEEMQFKDYSEAHKEIILEKNLKIQDYRVRIDDWKNEHQRKNVNAFVMLERAEDVETAVLLAMRPWYQRWLRHVLDQTIPSSNNCEYFKSLCISTHFSGRVSAIFFSMFQRKM